MKERRKFQRYDINKSLIVVIIPQAGPSDRINCQGINVAAEGMVIKRGQSLPESSPIKIEIIFHFEELKILKNLEGALIMTVTGHVVRAEPDRIAIRFNKDYEMSESLSFLLEKAPENIVYSSEENFRPAWAG